jgi:DNA-directed RNA polymerase subunit beta
MEGYNKDAIVVSERLASGPLYLHPYREFEVSPRYETSAEEITRDIPNVGRRLKILTESGIIRIGAKVKPGDYLVGKSFFGRETTQS